MEEEGGVGGGGGEKIPATSDVTLEIPLKRPSRSSLLFLELGYIFA